MRRHQLVALVGTPSDGFRNVIGSGIGLGASGRAPSSRGQRLALLTADDRQL